MRRTAPVCLGWLAIAALCFSCGRSDQHHALRGRVTAKGADQLTVSHQEIPGFMAAMTMAYPVKDLEAFRVTQPGDVITADLVVDGHQRFWLERVVVIGKASDSPSTATETGEIEVENAVTRVGVPVPDVPLTNQDGKTFRLTDFPEQAVLITFVYTRCPFPTFCPLLSSEFAAIQRELAATPDLYAKTHLVSITLDPAFDTPAILRKYGLGYLKGDASRFAQWDFAASSPADLKVLAAAFGLSYYDENDLITHSMRTVLVSTDGKVASIWDGGDWRKQELIDALRGAAQGKQ